MKRNSPSRIPLMVSERAINHVCDTELTTFWSKEKKKNEKKKNKKYAQQYGIASGSN